jgi:hypothetical protein
VEADGEFLPYLTVVIGDDVAWVGVDAAQTRDAHLDSGFLPDFARSCLRYGFTDVLRSTRQSPKTVVGPFDE